MFKLINLIKISSTTLLGILLASALASKPASANNALTVTIEAPGVQSTLAPSGTYVVDFNDQVGTAGFTKTNDSTTYTYGGDLTIKSRDQWGGASGSKYITQASNKNSFNVNINQDQKYFGFWWSAGDPSNKIIFKNDGQDVAIFETKDLTSFINSSAISNATRAAYKGNPNCASGSPTPTPCGSNTGHKAEPFAYVNVYFNDEAYDEVVIQTLTVGGAKFESDNHTFSTVKPPVSGVNVPQLATAMPDLFSTSEDSGTTGNVISNDLGVNLSVIKVNDVTTNVGKQVTLASGALVTLNSNGTFTYNPNSKFESLNPNETATDTFSYTIRDNQNNNSTATVSMTIDGAADNPEAANDSASTDENTVTWISVLQNDSDPNTPKENLTITNIGNQSIAVNGRVTLGSGATIELFEITDSSKHSTQGKYILKYDPTPSASLNSLNNGQSSIDTFTYTVSDPQGNVDQATVSNTVSGITDSVPD
jgi:VCBS repeat-containing protein